MRRIWMLLLVVTLMVIALAVPAMAETHTGHDGWEALTADTKLVNGGKYFLPDGLTKNLTVDGMTVTICLNGQTWSGATSRPLQIKNGGNVTICDCCYTSPENPGNGKIQGYTMSGTAGAVYVFTGSTLTLESGTITGGKGTNGGNIYNQGTTVITGGVVSNGEATSGSGGNIWSNATLNISGGVITGGVSTGNGGNIYTSGNNSSFTMSGSTVVTLGESTQQNGGNIATQGAMDLNGGTVSNGIVEASGKGGDNIYIDNATGKVVNLNGVTVLDDSVTSSSSVYFNATKQNATVNIKGGTQITGAGKPTVYVVANNTGIALNVQGCTLSGEPMKVSAASGKSLTVKITGTSTIGGQPVKTGSGTVTFNYLGVLLNNDWSTVYTLYDAGMEAEGTRAYIKVLENPSKTYNGQTLYNKMYYLDLNGMALTNVKFAKSSSNVKLMDSTAVNYEAGTGYITLHADSQAARFVRDCRTNNLQSEGTYNHNYRFVVIKDGDRYTAHRIYLAVRSASLIAREDPAAAFRIALRCDDVVASKLVGYGLHMQAGDNHLAYYTNTVDVSTDNSKLVGLKYTSDEAAYVNEKFTGKAYIILNDGLDTFDAVTDDASAIAAIKAAGKNVVTSGGSNLSLMDIVKDANGLLAADKLSDKQEAGLSAMINGWAQAAMQSWSAEIADIWALISK